MNGKSQSTLVGRIARPAGIAIFVGVVLFFVGAAMEVFLGMQRAGGATATVGVVVFSVSGILWFVHCISVVRSG